MMKKIGALMLALMMVLAMSSIAFATTVEKKGDVVGDGIAGNTNGVWEDADSPIPQGTTLTFHKEITVYNPETCEVNAPAVTYAYSIGSGEADKTITDDKGNHDPQANVSVLTKAGVGSPTITGFTLDPESDTLNASVNGTANWFDITVDFSGVNFLTAGSGAGVYRYVITETTKIPDKKASGIVDGNNAANDALYLDVYVNGDGSIYGYVLFKNNGDIDATTGADAAATAAGKVEGYVDSADNTEYTSDTSTADKYYTFNIEIKKDVVNDSYISTTSHQFPFSVAFANDTVTSDVLPIVSKTGTATVPTLNTAGGITSFYQDGTNLKIADDGVVLFKGLPAGTTVTIDEKNTVTGTVYTTTTTGATVNEADGINLTWNTWASDDDKWADKEDGTGTVFATGGTALTRVESNFTSNSSAPVIFVNTLLQISPTGVVLRVAPYVLMLGAGIFLLLISRRRKNNA